MLRDADRRPHEASAASAAGAAAGSAVDPAGAEGVDGPEEGPKAAGVIRRARRGRPRRRGRLAPEDVLQVFVAYERLQARGAAAADPGGLLATSARRGGSAACRICWSRRGCIPICLNSNRWCARASGCHMRATSRGWWSSCVRQFRSRVVGVTVLSKMQSRPVSRWAYSAWLLRSRGVGAAIFSAGGWLPFGRGLHDLLIRMRKSELKVIPSQLYDVITLVL